MFSLHDLVNLTYIGLCSITSWISHQRFHLSTNKGIKTKNMKDLHYNMRLKFTNLQFSLCSIEIHSSCIQFFVEVLKYNKYAIFSSDIETLQVPRIR